MSGSAYVRMAPAKIHDELKENNVMIPARIETVATKMIGKIDKKGVISGSRYNDKFSNTGKHID